MIRTVTSFVSESYEELKKVSFPTRAQTVRLTQYVIGVSFAVGAYVIVLDNVFKAALELLLGVK